MQDYRRLVARVQRRANEINRGIHHIPAADICALIAECWDTVEEVERLTAPNQMERRYHQILEDVTAGLTVDGKAARAAIDCGWKFVRH